VPRPLPTADQLGRLETVQTLHSHIQEDHCEVLVEQPPQGLLAGTGFDETMAKSIQDRLQDKEVSRLVVDE
jgi:hypothetical protein